MRRHPISQRTPPTAEYYAFPPPPPFGWASRIGTLTFFPRRSTTRPPPPSVKLLQQAGSKPCCLTNGWRSGVNTLSTPAGGNPRRKGEGGRKGEKEGRKGLVAKQADRPILSGPLTVLTLCAR
ncbi:hypothetical protein SODALDRAFT_182882 [Sodiomyces alkalinus F11]|uniref:Uncharacterized protein n=1 Tax=Sodiomyces alkalinus (strain CBS 110278 / VKM F-3762 / F11) TaxID=1314773 RepID=A0A3N2PUM2_SODAK|nr:hypothetical protein SODALDRAFT_182882 [Sodiomyces alkalinus F11]ROT38154.1 hypothetical protein SODALDRAFT_182882 [Sodiomyces alkalinus F11]